MPMLVQALLSQGLSLLGNAVLEKGKEAVEEKLGIKIPDSPAQLTPEVLQQLKIAEMHHEEVLMEMAQKRAELEVRAEEIAQGNVTDRWKADMSSDSWLSKNVRPMALVYWTVALSGLIILDGFLPSFTPDQAYVILMAEIVKMVYAAYFVGRTVEKGIELHQVHKTAREAK